MESILNPEEKQLPKKGKDGGQWPDVSLVSSSLLCHTQAGASVTWASTLEWQGGNAGRTASGAHVGQAGRGRFVLRGYEGQYSVVLEVGS